MVYGACSYCEGAITFDIKTEFMFCPHCGVDIEINHEQDDDEEEDASDGTEEGTGVD